MSEVSRRRFLAGGVGVAAGVAANTTLGTGRASAAVPAFTSTPFAMGVASGDPFTASVCLWTRPGAEPDRPGFGMDGQPDTMTVHWRIAQTGADLEADSTSVAYGDFDATRFDGHSVHVVAQGLTPGTKYYYRFCYTEPNGTRWTSAFGHTRTAPAHSATETVRFVRGDQLSVSRPQQGQRRHLPAVAAVQRLSVHGGQRRHAERRLCAADR